MVNSSRTPVLQTEALTIRFGGHVAVDRVSAAFEAGSLTAIVGPNGAGKTTYFNLISGQLPPSSGTVYLNERDISRWPVAKRARHGLGRAFQLTQLFPNLTVEENLGLVVQARHGLGHRIWTLASRQQAVRTEVESLLDTIGLTERADDFARALSHGAQRRLEVGMMLAMDPQVMMFDEPTAGMSVDEAPVLLELIHRIKNEQDRTILLVEHKLDVIRTLADRILVLHNGRLLADGEPESVMQLDVVRQAYLGELSDEEVA
ncbi:ABC transporter ATP-binding protein [Reinekea blandensis]|uniref:Branched-chain amino acid ABC transporter, ATP-binding protein n=1 Tax=Reinekea blandensis MED297 TaxID=314283 RepID=A4BDV5_9GAMM|nr:ABC transporter ATP-binding protein [Reinekea blandensis]EAR09714.1 branched-chain amino acid ABC transporter, ATP-binding protein [Reinekea blandensis MED297]